MLMFFFFFYIVLFSPLYRVKANKHYDNLLYQSVGSLDKTTFDLYSSQWSKEHSSWIGIVDSSISCENKYYFPVCVNGYMLDHDKPCADVVCLEKEPLVCDVVTPPGKAVKAWKILKL